MTIVKSAVVHSNKSHQCSAEKQQRSTTLEPLSTLDTFLVQPNLRHISVKVFETFSNEKKEKQNKKNNKKQTLTFNTA